MFRREEAFRSEELWREEAFRLEEDDRDDLARCRSDRFVRDRFVRSVRGDEERLKRCRSARSDEYERRSFCCRSDRAFSLALRGTRVRFEPAFRAYRLRSREVVRRPTRPLLPDEERRVSD